MSEMDDVVQIIRVEYEGVELAMKLGSASIKTVQKAVSFLINMLRVEKSKGKTGLKSLLMRGGDLQVFQFKEERLAEVEKLCKKYGILYSLVPKLDKDATTREILFHAEATPRVNLMLQKMKNPKDAQIKTMDKFLDETDDKSLGAFEQYIKEEVKRDLGKHADLSAEEMKRLTELSQRMRRVAAENDTQLADITIAKKMVEAETIEAIMTRIPGTWGDEARYIWINKHDAMEIHDGKTILSYLDKNKPYDLYDKNNNKVGQIKGDDLFKNHYSSVDKSLRKKYEKTIKTPTLDKRKTR